MKHFTFLSCLLASAVAVADVQQGPHIGSASVEVDVGHPHDIINENVVAFPSVTNALEVSGSVRGEDDLDTEAGTAFEPSGLYWHRGMQRLIIVDDEGYMATMTQEGADKVVYNLKPAMAGSRDDLEAVTAVDMDSTNFVWVGWERGSGDKSIISKIDYLNPGSTTTHEHYDVDTILGPFTDSAWKMEALTFIPDEDIPYWIVEDYSYDSSNGVFLASRQEDGKFFLIDIDPEVVSGDNSITTLTTNELIYSFYPTLTSDGTNRADVSDLHWDRTFKTLYILVDDDGSDANDPPRSSEGPRTLYGYSIEQDRVWAEWWLPGWTNEATGIDNPEGFAIGQERDTFYIGNDEDDAAGLNYVLRYDLQVRGETDLRARNVTMWRDPDANDDELLLYSVGSRWDNVADNRLWFMTNDTAGAAGWVQFGEMPEMDPEWSAASNSFLRLSGGTMTGNIDLNAYTLDNGIVDADQLMVGTVPLSALSSITTNEMAAATVAQIHAAGGGGGYTVSTNNICVATHSGSETTYAHSGYRTLEFDTANMDTGGNFNTVTHEYIVPESRVYFVIMEIRDSSTQTTRRAFHVRLDGVAKSYTDYDGDSNTYLPYRTFQCLYAEAGQALTVTIYPYTSDATMGSGSRSRLIVIPMGE